MLAFAPDFARTVVAFVVVLGVLVFFHELGHYLAARLCNVHVETFSIGFGRAFATWSDRRGTVWKLAWIPLGGYVKLHGQERPDDVPADVRALWIPGKTFHEKRVGARAFVVAAGPIANFLLAIVLFAALFATAGRPIPTPVVGDVVANSAASRGGLEPGDRIATIDGTPINRFEDIQHLVASHPGVALTMQIERAGVAKTVTVTPDPQTVGGGKTIGLLGIRGGETEFEKLGVGESIVAGISQTWTIAAQTLSGVWHIITTHTGTADLGGPLRIAELSGQVAQLGVASLVSFIAVLSVNLGLINLFPIPILDGGHLLFYLIEAVRGRPLPPRALEYGFRAGFAVLVALFVFATWNDLSHLGIVRWFAGVVG